MEALADPSYAADLSGRVVDGEPIGADIETALRLLAKEVSELVPAQLGDAVERITALESMLAAVKLDAVAAFDASMEWSVEGFRHPSGWIKDRCRVPRGGAGRQVGLGRKLAGMPHTSEALRAGRIGLCHVDRLARANSPCRAEAFAEGEAMLVAHAEQLPYRDFAKAVDYFEQLTDPEPDGTAERRSAKRSAHSSPLLDGTGRVDATLEPIGFAAFDTVLRSITKELFEADWKAGVAEHGDGVTLDQLGRTPAQRRADALVEMARRAATAPADGLRPLPLVIVHIDHATLEAELARRVGVPFQYPAERTCELQDGTVVTPGEALALALEGHVRRLVYDTPDARLRYGRKKRLFTGVLRELIQVRDRTCTGPGCDTPAYECDVDHIIEWQHGGTTDPDNGDCKCPWHHDHKNHYDITVDPVTGAVRWHRRR